MQRKDFVKEIHFLIVYPNPTRFFLRPSLKPLPLFLLLLLPHRQKWRALNSANPNPLNPPSFGTVEAPFTIPSNSIPSNANSIPLLLQEPCPCLISLPAAAFFLLLLHCRPPKSPPRFPGLCTNFSGRSSGTSRIRALPSKLIRNESMLDSTFCTKMSRIQFLRFRRLDSPEFRPKLALCLPDCVREIHGGHFYGYFLCLKEPS